MKERLKTFLLIFLVSISVLLVKDLWLQTPEQLIRIVGDKEEKGIHSYVLSDMIAPSKYLLNFTERNHTIMYDDSKYGMWSKSRDNLIEALSSEDIELKEISNDEFLDYHDVKSLVFYFTGDTNTYILARAWEIKNPNNIMDIMPNIDSIYIYLGSGSPFFIFSNGEKHIMANAPEVDTSLLKEEMDEIIVAEEHVNYHSMKDLGIKSNIFTPVEFKYSLPEIYVANDVFSYTNQEKEQLAGRFIESDIAYIRQIVEGNGSTIYVYNQQVLKLNSNGTIEYFQALEKKVTERNLFLSLSTAADFLSHKADVQKGMYLAGVQEIEQDENYGYRLYFRYRVRGIPVILGNKTVEEYVTIEVFNDHVRSYKYYARKDMNKIPNKKVEEEKMLSAYDVIDKNYDYLVDLYLGDNNLIAEETTENIRDKVLSYIEDVALAYYDPCLKEQDEKLIPVWAITFSGKTYVFDAYNGILVYER